MSLWSERILSEFPPDLARFWVAADPDAVLLDERILAQLRERGFEVMPFDDPVIFRADYEERWRGVWDRGEQTPAQALVLAHPSSDTAGLPWDYQRQARAVQLSLANLFPRLSYGVVRQIAVEHRDALYAAHRQHAAQSLGEAATKEFVLTHIFRIGPHLILRVEDLWRELLRLHYRGAALPAALADHVEAVLSTNALFDGLPVSGLFASRAMLLRVVQEAWERFVADLGIIGRRIAEPGDSQPREEIRIPFEHPDIRALVDSMFMDGMLHPVSATWIPDDVPDWVRVGMVKDPLAKRNLVRDGLDRLLQTIPAVDASHAEWGTFAQSLGEILCRLRNLEAAHAQGLRDRLNKLNAASDAALIAWLRRHYADLPSLPPARGPVMLHQVPRFLAIRYGAGGQRVALLVLDGLALDQWVQIREHCTEQAPYLHFDEATCFAWLPTLTSVSRQALFSGLRPREFSDSIETTSVEPRLWSRFWQDQGLRPSEIVYQGGIRRTDDLDGLFALVSNPGIKVAGIVVNTVDDFVHGAVLGKRGITSQIESWCMSGFFERILGELLGLGFKVYLTADHGNADAAGVGRPNQGLAAEARGERVRVYRSVQVLDHSAKQLPGAFSLEIPALPPDYLPLFAGGRDAFVTAGEPLVAHGGVCVEELIVPFVSVSDSS